MTNRLTIALDLDGVVYQWSRTARYLLSVHLGYRFATKEPTTWHWDIQENVNPEDWHWLWTEGVKLGLFRHGHVVKGAIDGIRELARDYDIVVVTHRPVNAVADTIAFLDHTFGSEDPYPFTGIHLFTHGEPKSTVPADFYIDDSTANVLELAENTPDDTTDVLLFSREWNHDMDDARVNRVHDWPDVVETIHELTEIREGA